MELKVAKEREKTIKENSRRTNNRRENSGDDRIKKNFILPISEMKNGTSRQTLQTLNG